MGQDQYAIKIDGSGRITLRNRKFLRKFSPVHYDRLPTRSIYDDLATRVTGLTPVGTPQLPDGSCPATHATQTGHTPPPTVTSERTPLRKTPFAAVTPATPGRDTHSDDETHFQTPRPAPEAIAPLRPRPRAPCTTIDPRRGTTRASYIGQRRPTRATSMPTWHKDGLLHWIVNKHYSASTEYR